MASFSETDFKNVVWDFVLTYQQFILNGYLHKRVSGEVYDKNTATWNALLLSLEAGAILGLAKLLERDKDFGRPFENPNLNVIKEKIMNMRHKHFAHNDLSKKRPDVSFFQDNQMTGSDVIDMFDALKKRAIAYQRAQSIDIDVQKMFTQGQNETLSDLDSWLKSFDKTL